MTQIHIAINIDNDAFVDRTKEELESILRKITSGKRWSKLADGDTVKLVDSNGNSCGHAYASDDTGFIPGIKD